jgi:putative ABC transport system permease protein
MFPRKREPNDFAAEIKAHLELETDQLKEQGLGEEDAQAAAGRAFGNITLAEERFYESSRWLWWDHLVQDLHFGLRTLRKNLGFASVAVLTLALGIGASTAMFSVINKVLFVPLPFKDSHRVVYVAQRQANGTANIFSVPDFLEWKLQSDLLLHMAAFVPAGFTLGAGDQPERITGAKFSHDMFYVLGVAPAIGRPFTTDEDRPGAGNFVLLSDALWKTRFTSNREIVGSKVDLDGLPYTVLGVMPPGFYVYANTELAWVPYQMKTQETAASLRTVHSVFGLARLKPSESVQQEQVQLDSIAARLHRENGQGDAGFGVVLQGYQDALTAGVKPALWLLMGCVGFVLLIACSNVANLLLVRASGRRMEIALRSAIGARRARLVRQLLTESLLLASLGGFVGLFLAYAGIRALVALHPASVPEVASISLEPMALLFTGAICLLVTALFGIVPALSASRVDVSNALREASRTSSRRTGKHRVLLVVAETALASILVIGAGLSLKSLWRVQMVEPGFNPAGLLTFVVPAPAATLTRQEPYIFYQRAAKKIRGLPGVQVVTLARNVPLSSTDPSMPVAVDGGPPRVTDGQIVTRLRVIGPDYFRGFQTPLLRGRELNDEDTATSLHVVIVSKSLAQRYWPNTDPIGHHLRPNIADAPWYTVVGVAADVRHLGLDQGVEPTAYYPYTQIPKSVIPITESSMTIVLRTSSNIAALSGSIRRAVATVDKTVPVCQMQTAEQMLADSGSLRRFDMWLIGVFAALALVLAAVGVYSVMAYAVSQRTREIGILVTLGAQRRDVLQMVMRQGPRMALVGVGVGVGGALALTRVMKSLLYEVSPTDVPTFGVVVLIVLALLLAACVVPSLRATRIDPIVALRCE